MTVENLQGDPLAEDDARLPDGDENAANSEAQHNPEDPAESSPREDAEEGEQRPRRPGRLERQAQRARAEAEQARREALEARRYADQLRRQLEEAHDAGSRLATQNLDGQIAASQQALREAIHAGDAEKVVEAQRRMSELAAAAAVVKFGPQREVAPPPPPVQQAPAYTPTTQAWLAQNPWFGSDQGLTQLAKSIHAQAERSGLVVDTPAYWKFIERGVEAVAPGTVRKPTLAGHNRGPALDDDGDEDDAPPARRSAAGSATVSRAPHRAPGKPGGEIKLTAEEVDAAKISGLTPQEYASWKSKLQAAGRLNKGGR